ncbi:YhdH/YhfP family quinone oxidoreductase [Gilvimarinus sp. F26214L]|uniref:YhdH/YhfP family quinone oxidoreductase n=1 Tax=Gilvimarinus sp. DZF01 TaxID=3461371 RepID=UPI0040452CB6
MSDQQFKALWVEPTGKDQFEQRIVQRTTDQLPEGELLVDVHYSSLNFKDALSAAGRPGVTRDYPHQPGIDAAGVVLEDRSGRFQPGDSVIVSGYDLGMNTAGGLGQRIRVPAGWAVRCPDNLSLKESMIIGTAGFTAALCVSKLLHMGADASDGTVIVSGATGGVGSFSVALLNHLGFKVCALTGKLEQSEWLSSLGAHQVLDRGTLSDATRRPLGKPLWAHGVDCVGGEILNNIIKSLHYSGSVAACGLTGGTDFHASVLPFILRGVNLLGVDCVELPLARKEENWQLLATAFRLPNLERMAESISLDQVPEHLTRILNGHAVGRYVVDLRA